MTDWEKRGLLWIPGPPEESPLVRLVSDKIDRMAEQNHRAWETVAEVAGGPPKPGIRYSAHILDRRTGERVVYDLGADCLWPQDGQGRDYWWSEGNFSCDCNRGMSFHRGRGIDEDAIELRDKEDGGEIACRHDDFPSGRRYVVKCAAEDGTELYRDKEWTEAAP